MEVVVRCPSCGESVSLWIDRGGGRTQEYIEDCAVCCRPMTIAVRLEADDDAEVVARGLDE